MSQPISRYLHPFDIAEHPTLEPEVKRAILASWASDRSAVRGQPSVRKPPGARARPDRRHSGRAAIARRRATADTAVTGGPLQRWRDWGGAS